MIKLLIKLPYTLYNRLTEIRDTYDYQALSETIVACIGSTYIDMILKDDKNKKIYHFSLPFDFVCHPGKDELGLIDNLSKTLYRSTGSYIQETIDKAILHKEVVKDLCAICPKGFYVNARKGSFAVQLDTNIYAKFKDLCDNLRSETSKVVTELLYYRLKMKGLIKS